MGHIKNQRQAKDNVGLGGLLGQRSGGQQTRKQHRNSNDKSGDRPGNANVKQIGAAADRRFDSDKRAQSADQCGRGNKEWPGCEDLAPHTQHIMAEFVRGKNRQQGDRKRQSQHQPVPVCQCPTPGKDVLVQLERGQAMIEVVLQTGADTKSAEQGQQKKQRMQPIAPFRRMNYYYSDFLAFRIKKVEFLRRQRIF